MGVLGTGFGQLYACEWSVYTHLYAVRFRMPRHAPRLPRLISSTTTKLQFLARQHVFFLRGILIRGLTVSAFPTGLSL